MVVGEKRLQRIKRYRVAFPPCISRSTSNFMKQLNTMKKKNNLSPTSLLEKKNQEKHLFKEIEKDLAEFEKSSFESRNFSQTQPFIESIGEVPNVPFAVILSNQESSNETEEYNLSNDKIVTVFNETYCILQQERHRKTIKKSTKLHLKQFASCQKL